MNTSAVLREDLNELSAFLRAAILDCPNPDDTLRLLHVYARLHWENISGFFDDEALELEVFDKWFKDHKLPKQRQDEPVEFLHVASQLFAYGGHSRLLRELLKGFNNQGTQSVVLTDFRYKSKVVDISVPVIKLKGSPTQRLKALLQKAANAKTVLLHIHPDDSIAALAARVMTANGKQVLFVNHADHVFSLGSSACDVALEICMTGWKTSRDRRAVREQSFMGIPIGGSTEQTWKRNVDGPIISMGGPAKFEPMGDLHFPRFVERMLPRIKNDFVLIGPSEKDEWWHDVKEKFPNRVSLLGIQPGNRVNEILSKASCYVDSFPLDGGSAYPQAAMVGLPCFGPNADNAPGVSPTDQLRFDQMSDMEDAIVKYLEAGIYPFDLQATRQQIIRDFANESITDRVLSAAKGIYIDPMPYLQSSGKRDSDYNARRWEEKGSLSIPKRKWRGISFRERARLLKRLETSTLSEETKSVVRKRLWTNLV